MERVSAKRKLFPRFGYNLHQGRVVFLSLGRQRDWKRSSLDVALDGIEPSKVDFSVERNSVIRDSDGESRRLRLVEEMEGDIGGRLHVNGPDRVGRNQPEIIGERKIPTGFEAQELTGLEKKRPVAAPPGQGQRDIQHGVTKAGNRRSGLGIRGETKG